MSRREHLRNLALIVVFGLALAVVPGTVSVYLRSFLMFTMMYVVLALSWNIISGFTGYTSFGHVAFYGIGAYACAILVADHGWHWIPTLLVGAVVAALVALAIGYPVLRLKGPYFAIAMLGAAEGTRVIATVWDSLTHGGLGISFPNVENSFPTYYAMLILMVLTIAVAYVVGHSRFGVRLNAIREDEGAAEALGVNTTRYKLAAFGLSAIFPAAAGGIQAYKVLYIDPPSVFFVQITIAMALMSMLGGKGTVVGPIVGAVLLYTIQELTWVNFPTAHLIAYGLFIIIVARFMPRGLMGFAIDRGWARKGMVH
ncbi:MAG TPA: branched-chain amino acid ABC transporter permease [Candidatus Limnocylindria bacterium]|nr:branched-chain amino acid ABC transporter permease [Candidatus Limnocylindria bacterium]